jgi:hypothetical protein
LIFNPDLHQSGFCRKTLQNVVFPPWHPDTESYRIGLRKQIFKNTMENPKTSGKGSNEMAKVLAGMTDRPP